MHNLNRKKGNIDRRDFDRALLTDTAPTDVPIIFSNDGFYSNLRRSPLSEGLKQLITNLVRDNTEKYTIPYRYRIRLSHVASRQLSLTHPAAQHRACLFYKDYGHLIPHFCRLKEVSLRRPAKIGSTFFYANRGAEKKRYKGAAIDLLLQDEAVRNPGSFFAYEGEQRFHRFFNSQRFVDLEKRFSFLRVTDVSKCFSSIYSHTLAWAVKDVQHGKESTAAASFANHFDALMQFSNYNETNGIPVGAETSRIFAEIILQSVDASVVREIPEILQFGTNYVVLRYIDDYLIFANRIDQLDLIQRALAESLLGFNLHLNEAKTHTIARPLQTRRSQIISGATPAVQNLREAILREIPASQVIVPKRIRSSEAVVRAFVNDIKVACTNGEAGYDEVSPFIIGALNSSIERLIGDYESVPRTLRSDDVLYTTAFTALLSALYYFYVVHATVASSYQVAKSTVLAIRFFEEKIPAGKNHINDKIRLLVQDVLANPSLEDVALTDCVPIEMLNVMLAASELPKEYQPNVDDITKRIISAPNSDYFSIISLLFYHGSSDQSFISTIENKLRKEFLPKARPSSVSADAHLMLDLTSCPHLSKQFRRECAEALLKRNSVAQRLYSNLFLGEFIKHPWFVDWGQIDLLNHLRKKELRPVY